MSESISTQVIKRDGSLEIFDSKKIEASISASCKDAGLGLDRGKELAQRILPIIISRLIGLEKISSIDIKEMIFAELEKLEPTAVQAWKRFDLETKGLSV